MSGSTPIPIRWALLVEYDGADFVGWQRQKNGHSVQEAIEQALGRLTGEPVVILGAGRTDAGVHALGQVAAFTTEKPLQPENVVRGGNSYLPPSVRIRAARTVSLDFNPRRDAIRRHYRYRLVQGGGVGPAMERSTVAWIQGEMDWNRVREALGRFRGVHDFAGFRSSRCSATRTVLDLERADLVLADRGPGPEFGAAAEFHFECRSFLHNMVRLLVGAALEAGRGGLDPEALERSLREGRRGTTRFRTAPPEGLCLMSVGYPPGLGLWGE